jgi:hypothetical protein
MAALSKPGKPRGRVLTPSVHYRLCSHRMFTIARHPDPRGIPFPLSRLVETRARLDVWLSQRAGALTPGARTTITVNGIPVACLRAFPGSRISIERQGQKREVLLVEDMSIANVPRLWFECPACGKRCRHIYLPEVACRTCLALDHACRHQLRRLRVARIVRLRRWLGTDERPFAAIPRPQGRKQRWQRLTMQLAQEERKLLDRMRKFVAAIEKEARDA